jgi:hypothetical protein
VSRANTHLHSVLLFGFLLLCVATMVHCYEHWEIAAHSECIAHAECGDSGEGGHDHGCSQHEHGSAVFEFPVSLHVNPVTSEVVTLTATAPPPVFKQIDQPPRLS